MGQENPNQDFLLELVREVCYGKPLLKIELMDGQPSVRKVRKSKKSLLWKTFIEN